LSIFPPIPRPSWYESFEKDPIPRPGWSEIFEMYQITRTKLVCSKVDTIPTLVISDQLQKTV
jgi:hypothetical protein